MSRSHTNPLGMQDQPDDVNSRQPGNTLETLRANTEEMEALRLTNQRLLRELEELTRQLRLPQEAHQTPKATIPFCKKNDDTLTLLGTLREKRKLAESRNMTPIYPLKRNTIGGGMTGITEAMNRPLISRESRNDHGSRGSNTSSRSSAT